MLNEFLLNGRLNSKVGIGKNIEQISNVLEYTKQDGNIPAIYGLKLHKFKFELSVLNNTIIGISYLFHGNKRFKSGKSFKFKKNISLLKFVNYLDSINANWEVDLEETGARTISISPSKTVKVIYNLEKEYVGFSQIVSFDFELYRTLKSGMANTSGTV